MKKTLLKSLLVAGMLTMGMGAWAQDETIDWDFTNLVKTEPAAWVGSTGYCATQFAPAVDLSDGRTGIQLVEKYETNVETVGDIIYQNVTGLENGTYSISFYANAFYTDGRGFASDMQDGATDVAYVFANNQREFITAHIATSTTENGEYTFNMEVTDGTIKIGLAKEKAGTNWHTIQIKSLIWKTTKSNILNKEKQPLIEAIAAAEAIENPSEQLVAAIAAAKAALETIDDIDTARAQVEAAIAALQFAVNLDANTKAVAGASATNPIVTDFVVNGTFDQSGVIAPWKSTTGAQNQTTANNQSGAFGINNSFFYENWNPSAYRGKMYQEIEGIPNGTYKLDIAAFVNVLDPVVQYVYANNDKVNLTAGEPTAYEVYTIVTNNKVEIGLEQTSESANWMGLDNAQLTYFGENVSIEDAKFGALIAQVDALHEEAIELLNKVEVPAVQDAIVAAIAATINVEQNEEALNAAIAILKEALDLGEASIIGKEKLAAMKELIDATNVYTEEAYKEYYGQWEDKYLAGTLTKNEANNLQNPSVVTGWHAAITVDNFLLSAWDTNPDFVDAPYYINSWSVEGDTDGSNFRVPFFEYWTGDANSLGERTLTATMENLPAGDYTVSAWTRARLKNGETTATANGITLKVNDGTAVDVTAGDQVGETQFRLGEFKATGEVKADGVLKIQFIVAAENNVSWLSFKNVMFTSDVLTGIEAVNNTERNNNVIYNLQGQQVKNAQKGLFIINGKKVVR